VTFAVLPSANKNPPIVRDGGSNKRKRIIVAMTRRGHTGRRGDPLALICIATMFDVADAPNFRRVASPARFLCWCDILSTEQIGGLLHALLSAFNLLAAQRILCAGP
jgi:hypothetical protein